MLTIKTVDPLQAIAWFKQGWRIFLANPVNWVLMALLFGVIVLLLGVLPIVGGIALNILLPVLTGGMLLAASRQAGRPVEVMDLFSLFRDEQRRNPLLLVGAMMLGAGLVAAILSTLLVGDALQMDELTGMPSLNLGMGAWLFLMSVGLVMGMLFMFAPALVIFKGMGAVDAVKGSFQGTAGNLLPFVVFVLLYAALAFVASIPFMLGFLVLVPVMMGAVYAAYRDIFA